MDWKFWKKNNVNTLNEANEEFKNKVKVNKETQGEGIEDFTGLGIGVSSLSSFSGFYNRYINQVFKTEREKIYKYRDMANMPEISDVIEDAVIESTQENSDDAVISLELKDGDLSKNKNIVNTLNEEFNKLFFDRLKIDNLLWNGMLTYFIDGRVYFERVKGPKDNGIVKLKKLPSESMDFDYDQYGNITAFYQYLTPNAPKPNGIEDAKDKDDVIAFYPEQITFIHTGYFGMSKKNIIGYLEKCTQAFNQLKMLETSLIIYRIVRAPERLVFKIDTGNMPKDKAMKYIDKVARKFKQKQTYNQQTGQIESQTAITSILENYFIGQSADGRGSDITTIGGNPNGFSEMDDIFYFQKKLYRSLKYPMSRVMKIGAGEQGDILYAGGEMGTIQRDEIKWAKFLERQQKIFCDELENLFLIHLEFTGLKKQYEIKKSDFDIVMTPPNQYKDQINQLILKSRMENYTSLAGNEEFPKSFLWGRFLKYDEDDFEDIKKGFEKDKEILPKTEENGGY